MTLPISMEELFKTDDPGIAQWTGHFHDVKGTERILKVWNSKLQGSKWEDAFVNSAVDVAVTRT